MYTAVDFECQFGSRTAVARTDLDVERAGEDLVAELVGVQRGAGPDDPVGFHPPELEPVVLVVAGTPEHGRVALGHLDDGPLDVRFEDRGRPTRAPADRRQQQQLQRGDGVRGPSHVDRFPGTARFRTNGDDLRGKSNAVGCLGVRSRPRAATETLLRKYARCGMSSRGGCSTFENNSV